MDAKEYLTYTFRSKPFGLRIQEPYDNGSRTSWQIVGVTNVDLRGKLIPGETLLVKINGKPPPTRFNSLADLLLRAPLPLAITFQLHGDEKSYSSSDDSNPPPSDMVLNIPAKFRDEQKTQMSKVRGKIIGAGKSRKDRFLRQLRLREMRKKEEDEIYATSAPRISLGVRQNRQIKKIQKCWEYEDVLEIMRMGGVLPAIRELEKTYSNRGPSTPRGDTLAPEAIRNGGWRGRVATLFGRIGYIGGRRVDHKQTKEMWKRPVLVSKKHKKRLAKRQHRRMVTFGAQIELGPMKKEKPSLSKLEKKKSALKTSNRRESFDQFFHRIFEERRMRKLHMLEKLKRGAVLLKYDSQGRPAKRWFCVSSDGTELYYCKRKPKAMIKKHAREKTHEDSFSTVDGSGKTVDLKSRSTLGISSPRLGPDKEHDEALRGKGLSNLFSTSMRRYYCADIVEQYLGPWVSGVNDKHVVPWRFFTLKFPERMLNLQCSSEEEMDTWFLGLQALAPTAPLNPLYLTRGRYLWKRLIMKIEYYGVDALRQFAISSPTGGAGTPLSHSSAPP
mmetsp:Transcript_29062/g.56598  ORF Transcript_29062/g.56598 Transcript_29062/m.56598 type:complete len:557 (+) Transcript_29062:66-1736(+)